MAGIDFVNFRNTDYSQLNAPTIILVEPQLGENIGMAARAMLNCGLTDLRLVNPRDGWPNDSAQAASAGAEQVINATKIFKNTQEAVADLNLVFATTARKRDMTNRILTPRKAALEMHDTLSALNGSVGVLFGPEAKGLKNEDVTQADAIIMIPVNPLFSSLNLAQAVFVIGYEWYLKIIKTKPSKEFLIPKKNQQAKKSELNGIIQHLVDELDQTGFFHVHEKRSAMIRNLRNIFQRACLTEQEARTLRGVISSLTKFNKS